MKVRTHVPETGDLWRLAMESSPIGMALVSPTGEFVAVNPALCDMLGYEPEALMRMGVHEVTHPDDVDTDRGLAQDALAGRIDSFRIAKRYVRADGSVMPGELSLALVRDEDGAPLHFVSQVVDLSERRAFEARLESVEGQVDVERRRVEAIFDAVDVGLLLIDGDGRYQTHNKRLQSLVDLAFPAGHRSGEGDGGFVFDADQERALTFEENPAVRAAAGEEFQDVRIWVGTDAGERRALSVSSRVVRDRSGDFAGAAVACHDVTDLMRAIEVRDEFLASVSHELRTPLTAALAYLELLDGAGDLDPVVRTQVDAVRRNALRLSHLVADLLFTATATSGAAVVDPFRADLSMVVAQGVDSAALAAQESGIALVGDLPETLVATVDGIRVRQVVDNLLANALAFTPSGGRVTVSLSATDHRVELVVADTGEGMTPDDLADVFAPFMRGENARRALSPGTGLGLTIVRTIVEAHGGEVSADSTLGEGTTVRVVLPR